MAQQTAVEWLYQRILAEDIKAVFEQAKAMEKEQIIKAASNDRVFQIAKYLVDGEESNLSLFEWRNTIKRDAEQYYNETYNK
jgi:hypothetical protein